MAAQMPHPPQRLTCSLVPRPLPDFISQPWRILHGCEIKSGSVLGMRLAYLSICEKEDGAYILEACFDVQLG